MSLNNGSWFKRVRLRLVCIYAAVTCAMLATCFMMVFLMIRHAAFRQLDRDVERNLILFTDEYFSFAGSNQLNHIQYEFDEESREIGVERLFLMITTKDGKILASSPLVMPLREAMRDFPLRHTKFLTVEKDKDHTILVRARFQNFPDGNRLIVGVNYTRLYSQITALFTVFSIALILMILISIATGVFFTPFVTRSAEEAMEDLGKATDSIAHDLRTPLTRMHGKAELAAMTGDSSNLAGDVAEECDSMLEMINTMLDIAQTEHLIQTSPREIVDLVAVARKAVELFTPPAEDKGIALSMETSLPSILFSGHTAKIQQLLGNLLDNAVKFTPKGGKVSVSLKKEDNEAVLQVKDTGCGIAAKDLPRIFERFYRADSSRTLPGNGLGLSLVRAVATSYGGKAKIESECGHGTCVTVTLPIH